MKEIFLDVAKGSGCDDLGKFESLVDKSIAQQHSVIENALASKLVPEEKFMEELSAEIGLPWHKSLEPEEEKKLREVFTAQLALKYRLLPLAFHHDEQRGEEKGRLEIATYDPFDLRAKQALSQKFPHAVTWSMASKTRVLDALQKLYGVGADTFEQILAEGGQRYEALFDESEEASIIDDQDEEASVVKFVNQFIRQGVEQRATDIHVEPLKESLRIRYRIDGMLHDITVPENIKALQSSVIARLKIMAKLDIAERRLPQDGRINLQVSSGNIDVRVATIPTVEGESISLRLLGQEKFNLERLELLPQIKKTTEGLLQMANGIILVTGPTGSGKSTTLYSFLSELNSTDIRIVTIEDPVEQKLDGVMQIAVKPEINLTFANGLRSILRGDPNVVMVGEIRDLETAEIAIRAALTGHLVFSTLHTNDAIGGIMRLIDMGVESFLVSASVRAFIAQRLVRRLCSHCKQPADVSEEYYLSGFPRDYQGKIYQPVGCDFCRYHGFHGRLSIYEVCVVSPELQDLITHKKPVSVIKEQAVKDGFIPLREYGWLKVMQGMTTIEEVLSATMSEVDTVGV